MRGASVKAPRIRFAFCKVSFQSQNYFTHFDFESHAYSVKRFASRLALSPLYRAQVRSCNIRKSAYVIDFSLTK